MPFLKFSCSIGSCESPVISRLWTVYAFWAEAVGATAACHTRPISLQGGILRAAASSASWAQQMTFCRLQVAKKLNGLLGEPVVTDIRFSPRGWAEAAAGAKAAAFLAHPSTLPEELPVRIAGALPPDPLSAFARWEISVRLREAILPACLRCQIAAPLGEIERWGVCAFCFQKGKILSSP